jgi:NAD dependent epimerase/dehydratase family enzyme
MVLRTDPALALTGRRAVPARLLDAGFGFRHPDLDEALADLGRRRATG